MMDCEITKMMYVDEPITEFAVHRTEVETTHSTVVAPMLDAGPPCVSVASVASWTGW